VSDLWAKFRGQFTPAELASALANLASIERVVGRRVRRATN
jgi:hypothetical protein